MFGGPLTLNEERRQRFNMAGSGPGSGYSQITVDAWMTFDASPIDARLLIALRRELSLVVEEKLLSPSKAAAKHAVIDGVVRAFS